MTFLRLDGSAPRMILSAYRHSIRIESVSLKLISIEKQLHGGEVLEEEEGVCLQLHVSP